MNKPKPRRWKRSDISDAMICQAVASGEHALYFLHEKTGCPKIVIYRAMERAESRGLLEYGVSLDAAWFTDAGRAYCRALRIEIIEPEPKGPLAGLLKLLRASDGKTQTHDIYELLRQ